MEVIEHIAKYANAIEFLDRSIDFVGIIPRYAKYTAIIFMHMHVLRCVITVYRL